MAAPANSAGFMDSSGLSGLNRSQSPGLNVSAGGSGAGSSSGSFSPQVQQALDEFASRGETKMPAEFFKVIADIAASGITRYAWPSLRNLLRVQLVNVMDDYVASTGKPADVDGETFEERYERLLNMIDEWECAPFTLQRFCELILDPKRFYRNTNKFFQAMSKVVHGISVPNAPVLDSSSAVEYARNFTFRGPAGPSVDGVAPMEMEMPPMASQFAYGAGGIMSTSMPLMRKGSGGAGSVMPGSGALPAGARPSSPPLLAKPGGTGSMDIDSDHSPSRVAAGSKSEAVPGLSSPPASTPSPVDGAVAAAGGSAKMEL